jgi:hypothetical protein
MAYNLSRQERHAAIVPERDDLFAVNRALVGLQARAAY